MKLYGWEKVSSSEEYRQMIEAEYYRLKQARDQNGGRETQLEEVKLRLFLSLLDRPGVKREPDPFLEEKRESPYPSAA
jgi:hypothetical protein